MAIALAGTSAAANSARTSIVAGGAPPHAGCKLSRTTNVLTVEDDIYGGAWTQSDPLHPRAYPHSRRPSNGVRWLPNCTRIAVRCARIAAPYHFKELINGAWTVITWKLWAQLKSRSWLRLADVAETTGINDPAQLGLRRC
jgi:hypothetical protein